MDTNYKTYMNSLVSVIVSSLDTKLANMIIDNEPSNWLSLVLNLGNSILLFVFLFFLIKLKRKINKLNNNIENLSIPLNSTERFYPMDTQNMSTESEIQPKTSGYGQYRNPKSIISEDSVDSEDSQSANHQQKINYYNAMVKPYLTSENHELGKARSAPYNVYSQ